MALQQMTSKRTVPSSHGLAQPLPRARECHLTGRHLGCPAAKPNLAHGSSHGPNIETELSQTAMHENRFLVSLDSSAGAPGSRNGCKGAKPSCLMQHVHQMRLLTGLKHLWGCGDGPCLQMMETPWCEGIRKWIVTMCFQ